MTKSTNYQVTSAVIPRLDRGIHKNTITSNFNNKKSWIPAGAGMTPGATANYQDVLKTLAIISMIVDHLGLYFFPEMQELRVIGRYAMPMFAFFAGYNFKNQINLTLLFVGSVLYIISTIFIFHTLLETNILISIFLGQVYLYLFREHFKNLNKGYIHFVILVCLWPLTFKFIDYGTVVIGIMAMGYMTRMRVINVGIAAFVVAFVSMLHSYVGFDGYFSDIYMCLAVLVAIFVYVSLKLANFETYIPVNLRIISRHTLLIYSAQWLIMQFLWRYYVN